MNSSHESAATGPTAAGTPTPTIGSLIRAALGLGVEAFEARLLLAHATGWRREILIAFDERTVAPGPAEHFMALTGARAQGVPIAYLVGQREFHGLEFAVEPGVLIPRPETEALVDFALTHAPMGAHVLDLGTGSGAIAISIAAARPDLVVTAVDRSDAALAIATRNNTHLAQGRVRLLSSDWYVALETERFGVIVSNPPYVAADDAHLSQGDLRHEPRGALTDEADGLQAIRRIVQDAPAHLAAPGWLALEHGWDQGAAVRALLTARGFVEVRTDRDLAGIERMSLGRWPNAAA